jgi:hypothetical protein
MEWQRSRPGRCYACRVQLDLGGLCREGGLDSRDESVRAETTTSDPGTFIPEFQSPLRFEVFKLSNNYITFHIHIESYFVVVCLLPQSDPLETLNTFEPLETLETLKTLSIDNRDPL